MNQEWSDKKLIDDYIASSDDPQAGWYENEINIPSIISLMPEGHMRVLDFGCGPGNLTAELVSSGFTAEGADASSGMVKEARKKYPHIQFYEWDGLKPLPADIPKYNVLVTKLTLEFITDLDAVATSLKQALVTGGYLLISVMHPLLAVSNHSNVDYWNEESFRVQIGTGGISVTKIQRTVATYINIFLRNGFVLQQVVEPNVPKHIQQKFGVKDAEIRVPKRLNLLFKVLSEKV